ncbi:PaaX family transcriptional regulator, partial [Streptomyces sp. MB09-02B]
MLAFFGNHVLEEGEDDGGPCVYSGSIIGVLGRVGVGEQAVRSTLTRMVNRGLLRRRREGRKMYFGLTPQATRVLWDGHTRIWEQGAVNDDWDGSWTLLGFSLPDSWKRQRHDLRSRLTWSGFGALYSGLWIAPGHVDIAPAVAELGLKDHVKIFHARANVATDVELMISDTWDLEGIASRYVAFDKRWTAVLGSGVGSGDDPIGTRLRLISEWLWTIRADPRLPARPPPPPDRPTPGRPPGGP